MWADLHTHTTASDGKCSPSDNIIRAKKKGLQAIAITDHDTVAGLDEAMKAGTEMDIVVVPGIEISSIFKGQDIHVLGYYVDKDDPCFLNKLKELRKTRDKRNEMMVKKLNELGLSIGMDEVYARKKDNEGNIGRPHIAEVLMEKGIVSSMEEAFRQYLGKEGRAYVNPPRISPFEAIDLIKEARGVPVVAHPGLYDDDLLIEEMIQYGLKGIEVFHPDHSDDAVNRYSKLASTYGLIMTGGSDFHGERNGEIFHGDIGLKYVNIEIVNQLKQLAENA
ncbi:PHP domain-containing protein [Microaerobacter geothermalis]|uniref:PHP domain-containing protein n=1 Tax=Microaerobacter geothermalis TaxID=674972 RepID=UPI001F2E4DEE|nr:PHP domain-containing protein [Microaerobacter geothermalis]MCF6094051.1 PHP domain-containing protein [Microaerobacter geothermalis]